MTASPRWLAGLPAPQARYWFTEQMSPGTPDAIDPFLFRLSGPVDLTALRESLRTVIGWHDALRTLTAKVGSRGVRVTVIRPEDVGEVLEVRRAEPGAHEPVLREFIARPFRLDSDLPIRALLVTAGGDGNQPGHLVVCTHHSAFDGWSATVFFSGLGEAYQAWVGGHPPAPRRPSDYRQIWLDQTTAESDSDRRDLLEWSRHVIGVPDLPLPRISPPAASSALGEKLVTLSSRQAGLLSAAATAKATTPNAILLTAWVRALRTFTGATDFAVAIPVSGRTSLASTTAVGCFVSVVALRFRGGHPDVHGDLAETIAGLSQALRFQFMPLEWIVTEGGPRDHQRTPLCQTAFVSQEQTDLTLRLVGAECRYIQRLKPESAFELTLEVWFAGDITARIRHRLDMLDDRRAARLAGLWRDEAEAVSVAVTKEPAR